MPDERPDGFTRDPWEQQPGESDRHFVGFEGYRRQGVSHQRSVFKAVAELYKRDGKTPPSRSVVSNEWHRAAKRWQWLKRAGAWDKFERKKLDAETDAARNRSHEQEVQVYNEIVLKLWKEAQSRDFTKLESKDLLREFRTYLERRSVAIDDTPETRERRRLEAAQSGFNMVTPADKGLA